MLARAAIYRLITSDQAAASRVGLRSKYLRENVEAHRRILKVLQGM